MPKGPRGEKRPGDVIGAAIMVAKIATDLAKPDGQLEVPPEGLAAFLAPLPIGRLLGVGAKTEATLKSAPVTSLQRSAVTARCQLASSSLSQ